MTASSKPPAATGRRTIKMAEWSSGIMTNALGEGELLADIALKAWPAGHGYAFEEFARRHGDFAITAVGCLVTQAANGTIAKAALCVSGIGPAAGAGGQGRATADRTEAVA